MPNLFIDGEWVASGDGTCSRVIDPSDGTVVTEVDVATDEQVQGAIAAARRAFDRTDRPRTPTGERAALLDGVADLLDRDVEEIARPETLPQAEWGGFKQSGIGRELGPSGLDEYREAKHIWQGTAPGPMGWFGG